MVCDGLDGRGPGPAGAFVLRSTVMRNPHPSTTRGPPGYSWLLCQSLSCSVATCTICVPVWATADWQVPSENMAHGVNARQACGLRGVCSCPSLFPTSSSVSAKAFRLPRLLSVTQQREAGGVTDRGGEHADSDLMDRCGVKRSTMCLFSHLYVAKEGCRSRWRRRSKSRL